MISYGDRTFCASPNCKNECGRQLTDAVRQQANQRGMLVSTAYFCDNPLEKEQKDVNTGSHQCK